MLAAVEHFSRNTGRWILYGTIAIVGLMYFAGCSPSSNKAPSVRRQMHKIYAETHALYGYVWSPEQFSAKKNREQILGLLESLRQDFDELHSNFPSLRVEPGYSTALDLNREQLRDIEERLRAGSTEYALWRLQGLTSNCISCHSRFKVSNNFIGDAPLPQVTNRAPLAAARFLLATRQFAQARDVLLSFAQSTISVGTAHPTLNHALMLLLLAEVRAEENYTQSSSRLSQLLASARQVHRKTEILLNSWIEDLRKLADEKPLDSAQSILSQAQEYISPIENEIGLDEQQESYVLTLHATSLLHSLLERGDISDAMRRQALLLLATAYLRLPLPMFDIYKELYLERVITEFPGSDEAKTAFVRYRDYVEETYTGSTGLHLDERVSERMKLLRRLAFQ